MSDTQIAAGPNAPAITDLLRRTGLFRALDDAQLDRIAAESSTEMLGAGETLFVQGQTGDSAYLVLEGTAAVEVETERGRVRVATIARGGVLGEIAAFAATRRTATIVGVEATRLLRIEQATIARELRQRPEAAVAIIAELGERLQSLNESIATLTQAANALADGVFESSMLDTLRRQADRFGHFARVFETMAAEITGKRLLAQEMRTAADIQASFLPRGIDAGAHASRFDVAALMRPARNVGGDFFDYFMIDDATIGIAVGDVSGKGVPAAIFMSVARTVLKTLARQGGEAGAVMARMNALLAEDNAEGMFVTLAFGRLDLVTGAFDCAIGGHEEAYLVEPGGALVHLAPTGPAVGLIDGMRFQVRERVLAPGTRVIFGTDGITEAFAPDGGMFGAARLEALMRASAARAPQAIVDTVADAVRTFADGEPQSDDLTCLALVYRG